MDLKRALKKFRGKSRKNRDKNFIFIEEKKKSFELSCQDIELPISCISKYYIKKYLKENVL